MVVVGDREAAIDDERELRLVRNPVVLRHRIRSRALDSGAGGKLLALLTKVDLHRNVYGLHAPRRQLVDLAVDDRRGDVEAEKAIEGVALIILGHAVWFDGRKTGRQLENGGDVTRRRRALIAHRDSESQLLADLDD